MTSASTDRDKGAWPLGAVARLCTGWRGGGTSDTRAAPLSDTAFGGSDGKRVLMRKLLLAFAGLVVSGCETEVPPASMVSDSAGVRIVRTLRAEWEDTVRLVSASLMRVPLIDDPSATPLSLVQAAIVMSDGRIALIDRQQQRVFYYDRDGRESLSVGGRGQGPGEFESTRSLWEVGVGGLEVYDSRLGRLTEFTPDGSVAQISTLPREHFPRPPSNVWRVDARRLLVWEYNIGDGEVLTGSGGGERWGTNGVLRVVDFDTGFADTLRLAPAWETIREGARLWMAPFAATATVTVANERIFFTTGKTHVVEVYQLAQGLVGSFAFPSQDVPVESSTLTAMEASARSRSVETGTVFEAGIIFEEGLQPDIRPAFEDLKVDPSGTIWAQRHEPFREESERWWLITPDGVYRGLVQMPDRSRLLSFSLDGMVVLRLDSLDVPSVEVWTMPDLRH